MVKVFKYDKSLDSVRTNLIKNNSAVVFNDKSGDYRDQFCGITLNADEESITVDIVDKYLDIVDPEDYIAALFYPSSCKGLILSNNRFNLKGSPMVLVSLIHKDLFK